MLNNAEYLETAAALRISCNYSGELKSGHTQHRVLSKLSMKVKDMLANSDPTR